MVSSCHVLTLLLCLGCVLEAQALFLKAAPRRRQLSKVEAGFLLDALVEKMKIPENLAKMVKADSLHRGKADQRIDEEEDAMQAVGPILHDELTKLGIRDDESPKVWKQIIAIVKNDPLLALKAKAYDTALQAGKPLSLLFHAMVIKAAPAGLMQITKEEAVFLFDALLEKMKIPEVLAKMKACDASADPDKAGLEAVGPIIHDALTKLGYADDESPEVWRQVIAIVQHDPILAFKAKAYETALKAGKTVNDRLSDSLHDNTASVSFHENAMVNKAGSAGIRQLTNAEAAEFLDMMIGKLLNPDLKMRLLAALKTADPKQAATSLLVPLMHDHITQLGFRDDEIDDVVKQVFAIAETDPTLAPKVEVLKNAMAKIFPKAMM